MSQVCSRTCWLCSYIGCRDTDLTFGMLFGTDVGVVVAPAVMCSKEVKVYLCSWTVGLVATCFSSPNLVAILLGASKCTV